MFLTADRHHQLRLRALNGITFARTSHRATPSQIPSIVPKRDGARGNSIFPAFEAILGPSPRIHETWVTCADASGREHRFLIAAQFSPEFEVNIALQKILPDVEWRGGLVVMRGGQHNLVVNMGGGPFKQLAEQAVRR